MSEKYYGLSPYNYCANIPILLVDPTGMWPSWGGIREGIRYAIGVSVSVANGALRAISDNLFLGSTNFRETGIYTNSTAYNIGQDIGDVFSVIGSIGEVFAGLGEVAIGVVGTPETLGGSLAISVKGAVELTHGYLMYMSATRKLILQEGRAKGSGDSGNGYAKSSGKNEKHSNLKAREAAKEKMEDAQKRLKTMEKQKELTGKEAEKLKKEIKHWRKKMNETGETHHRK